MEFDAENLSDRGDLNAQGRMAWKIDRGAWTASPLPVHVRSTQEADDES